ncbi:MAG: fatty acid desaturase [Rickettsiaceae bacterium]|nr:fatty acid desaturase [Rickettsiaceae bacterium]
MNDTNSKAYWDKIVNTYKNPSVLKSIGQLVSTFAIFSTTCVVMYIASEKYYWLSLILSLFAGSLIIKLFIIQHDCGHGSFFKSNKANDFVGRMLTVFTMTPYGQWAKEHNRHHATAGNLNHRGVGDVTTFTVKEYLNSKKWKRALYRFYRNPLFLFSLGAVGHFIIKQRFAFYKPRRISSWISVMMTNLYIASVIGLLMYFIGPVVFIKLYLPIIIVASSIGTWMFYMQHQFENTYWEPEKSWNYCEAAIRGSSFYNLPKILHWLSGNIGYHHIHHLSSKIPNYNLAKCYNENPVLQNAPSMTLWESRKCLGMALWDEDKKKMIGFGDLPKNV